MDIITRLTNAIRVHNLHDLPPITGIELSAGEFEELAKAQGLPQGAKPIANFKGIPLTLSKG